MSGDNRLQRLSAQASVLFHRPDADLATLDRARAAYREAADLFKAESETAPEATRPTLQMLTNQHNRMVRDAERRIASLGSGTDCPSSPATTPKASASPALAPDPFTAEPSASSSSSSASLSPARPSMMPRGATSPHVGLAAGRGGILGGAGLAVHATSARSVPPFALRPVPESGSPTSPSSAPPPAPFITPGSPLYSSSSSSEPPDESSYLFPGAEPDTADPFGRFWGMLENMLEEISFPKALTTAPLDMVPRAPPLQPPAVAKGKGRAKDRGKERTKRASREPERSPSPSESFYVVPRDKDHRSAGGGPHSVPARKSSPSAKTPEELALENESLRASLDAMAAHAHTLELANKDLRQKAEERDSMLRSMVSDVRHEARKARHQEVLRSQMLAASTVPPQRVDSGGQQSHAALRKRVGELEDELGKSTKRLEEVQEENAKLAVQLEKYKERWDKLKAKKEAKARAARTSRSPEAAA